MEIVTVQFNYKGRPDYKLLLDVFRYSVKLYMPNVKFIEYKIPPPPKTTNQPLNFHYNVAKLKIWRDHLFKTKTDKIIFADCDMLALKSAEHAFKQPFDIAYTARTILVRIPMNGGIVFARNTDGAKRFFNEWCAIDNKMLHNVSFHHQWRKRYAGMNQSSFGYVFEKGKHKAHIHKYITREWNAVDCDWNHINGKTVFLHIKSRLRKLCLKGLPAKGQGKHTKAMQLWFDMKKRMESAKRKK